MFMTSIVVGNKFWGTLTDTQKEAFQKAALYASRKEREWSVEDGKKFERDAAANGVTITEISEEDRAALKKKSQITYVKCRDFFSPNLITRIRKSLH
jgi:TRAP-type C4-dicarboxylate transport system substrate-binding protein